MPTQLRAIPAGTRVVVNTGGADSPGEVVSTPADWKRLHAHGHKIMGPCYLVRHGLGQTGYTYWVQAEFVREEWRRCASCKPPGVMNPPHNPSPECNSGMRPHCSCDVCF